MAVSCREGLIFGADYNIEAFELLQKFHFLDCPLDFKSLRFFCRLVHFLQAMVL